MKVELSSHFLFLTPDQQWVLGVQIAFSLCYILRMLDLCWHIHNIFSCVLDLD